MALVRAIYAPEVPKSHREVLVSCDRCSARVSVEAPIYYNCLQCPNFIICEACSLHGIYCQDDTHDWIECIVNTGPIGVLRCENGPRLTSKHVRELQLQHYRARPYPTRFQSPTYENTPDELFSSDHRFISNNNPREILIYTDGSCLDNGGSNPKAGWAFVYRPSAYTENGELTHSGTVSFALEANGPTGQYYKRTSNRAELRAVIAALQFRDWSTDCNRSWRSVVIATDSEYVAVNVTERVQSWETAGWKVQTGAPVKNPDLWIHLLMEIRQLQKKGVHVSFWRIPRELNKRADESAKSAATNKLVDSIISKPNEPIDSFLKRSPQARVINIPSVMLMYRTSMH